MDIEAAFPSVAEGRLVNLMKIRKMDGDLHTMNGELSLGKNGGDDNRGQRHGKTPSESGGPAGLTCVTDPLCNLHLRTDKMGRRVRIRS